MATVKRRACSKCGKNRAEKFYVSARGRVCSFCRKGRTRDYNKDERLQETYGITLDEWQQILDLQGGVCAICLGKRVNYDTDHDHGLEKAGVEKRHTVRGLLCKRCNRRLLPACLDRIDILQRAISYLLNPPAEDVLSWAEDDS